MSWCDTFTANGGVAIFAKLCTKGRAGARDCMGETGSPIVPEENLLSLSLEHTVYGSGDSSWVGCES